MKFYSKSRKLEEHLIKAAEILRTQGGQCPDTMWVPKFGYVLIDREPTETLEAFLEEMNKPRQNE